MTDVTAGPRTAKCQGCWGTGTRCVSTNHGYIFDACADCRGRGVIEIRP